MIVKKKRKMIESSILSTSTIVTTSSASTSSSVKFISQLKRKLSSSFVSSKILDLVDSTISPFLFLLQQQQIQCELNTDNHTNNHSVLFLQNSNNNNQVQQQSTSYRMYFNNILAALVVLIFPLFSLTTTQTCPFISTFSTTTTTSSTNSTFKNRSFNTYSLSTTAKSSRSSGNSGKNCSSLYSRVLYICLYLLSYCVIRTTSASSSSYELSYFAGGGTSLIDNIPATSANLSTPTTMFADTNGGLYITESIRQRVRYIDSSGYIKTIAGGTISTTTSSTAIGDGGQATSAILITPNGLCGSTTGILYIVETSRNRIRRVNLNTGIITTLSLTTSSTVTTLLNPTLCRIDGNTMYLVDRDNGLIRSIDITNSLTSSSASAAFTTYVGSSSGGNYGGDGNTATSSNVKLGVVYGIAKDSSGFYVAAGAGIRKVDSSTSIINKYAGSATSPGYVDDVSATSARFYGAYGSYLDTSASEYFVCDFDPTYTLVTSGLGRVRRISSSGIVSTIAGTTTASQGSSSSGIAATAALIYAPTDITGDSSGNLYILESSTGMVKRLKPMVPSVSPTAPPTVRPTTATPTMRPTTVRPTPLPTVPTVSPTTKSPSVTTAAPTMTPTLIPSVIPTEVPTVTPTASPTTAPSTTPSVAPSQIPSVEPTGTPIVSPSDAPSLLPSYQPTEFPSLTPTTLKPSAVPTTSPSEILTAIPTQLLTAEPTPAPSLAPTSAPSIDPTVAPTAEPTLVPTVIPTYEATREPSSTPTDEPTWRTSPRPTALPTLVPTMSPTTALPTSAPTESPSEVPSAAPSSAPTAEPSQLPTLLPTELKTVTPTVNPTTLPTFQESSQPSRFPTERPSLDPTLSPSSEPTALPTVTAIQTEIPTMIPSFAPTKKKGNNGNDDDATDSPSIVPSRTPTMRPTQLPTTVPTKVPTPVPSIVPSVSPTAVPTTLPSVVPTLVPTNMPSVVPTLVPTTLPSMVPTLVPTPPPTVVPTIVPSYAPTLQPSKVPSQVPTQFPTVVPSRDPTFGPTTAPSFSPTMTPSIFPTFDPTAEPTTRPTMKPSAAPSVFPTNLPSMAPTDLPTLLPTDEPTAFPTESPTDTPTLVPTLVPTNAPSALPTISPTQIPTTEPTDWTSVSPSQLPTMPPTLTPSDEPTVKPTTVPTTVPVASPTTRPTITPTIVPTMTPTFAPSDVPTAAPSLAPSTVSPSQATVVVPAITKAQLSDDGSFVTLTFNVDTNRGDVTSNPFQCSTKLNFVGVQVAKCQWQDSRRLQIFPSLQEKYLSIALNTGSVIQLLSGNSIKRDCSSLAVISNNSSCNNAQEAKFQEINVAAPQSPIRVTASMRLPSVISSCDSLRVDLTSSSGDGSRGFRMVSFSIRASSTSADGNQTMLSVAQMTKFLNEYHSFYFPFDVSKDMLLVDTSYRVTMSLCNFMNQCDTVTSVVAVSSLDSTAPPVVIIAGSSQRVISRTAALSLSATASVYKCGQLMFPQPNMIYSWSVAKLQNETSSSGVMQLVATPTAIASVSRDRTRFMTNAYTFQSGSIYIITVRTVDTITKLASTANVELTIPLSDVVVKLEPSTCPQILRVLDTLSLDASGSYDPDYPDATLKFIWSCSSFDMSSRTTISGSPCPLKFSPVVSGNNSSMLVAAPTDNLAGETYRVLLEVRSIDEISNVRRVTEKHINIVVVERSRPVVKILTSANDVNNFNADRRLVLTGSAQSEVDSCQAKWSINDASLNLAGITLTSVSNFVPNTNTPITWNLVLPANSLVSGTSYSFNFACGSSAAAIEVKTNAPPGEGSFILSPSTGVEIMTTFLFSAMKWIDQDLPLSYQFTYVSVNTGLDLMIQSKSEVNFVSSLLPSGNSANDYALTCKLQVFDSYGAATSETQVAKVEVNNVVDVTKFVQDLLLNTTASSSENNSTTSGGVATMLISLASSVLNKVDCSSAPNCSLLHRSGCQFISGYCGDCLNGYVGQRGPSNAACTPIDSLFQSQSSTGAATTSGIRALSVPSRVLMQVSTCQVDSDCPLTDLQYCQQDSSSDYGTCHFIRKKCPKDCSGHGTCSFVFDYPAISNNECTVLSTNCVAVCSCHPGYSGSSCSMATSEYEVQSLTRSVLLQGLDSVNEIDTIPSIESIQALVYSLSDVVRSKDDFNGVSLSIFYKLSMSLLNRVLEDDNIDYTAVVNLLTPLNDALSLATLTTASTGLTSSSMERNLLLQVLEQLNLFGKILVRESLEDVDSLSFVQEYFRFASESYGHNSTHTETSVPLLPIEIAADPSSSSSSVALSLPKQSTVLQIVEIKSFSTLASSLSAAVSGSSDLLTMFDKEQAKKELGLLEGQMYGNPLSITSYFENGEVLVKVHHTQPASFLTGENDVNSIETFKTNCTTVDDVTIAQYKCADSGYEVIHRCNGTIGTFVTMCPKQVMTCSQLVSSAISSSSMTCEVESTTLWFTTCRCSPPSDERRRRLEYSQQEAFTITAVAYYATDTVKSTFEASDDFFSNQQGLEKSYVALMVIGSVWLLGLTLFLHQSSDGKFFSLSAWKKTKTDLMVGIGEKDDDRHDEEIGGVGVTSPRKTNAIANAKTIVVQSLDKSNNGNSINTSPAVNGKADYEKESLAYQQITSYIQHIFPQVFHHSSWKGRVWNELRHHHPLLRSFLVSDESQSHSLARGKAHTSTVSRRQGTYYSLHAWCVMNLMVFLLALFYDLEQPPDDGSCYSHLDMTSCQQRTLTLDPSRTYCSWNSNPHKTGGQEEGYCTFADQSISPRAAVSIAVMVSLLTVFILQVSLALLQIACAPTSLMSKSQDTSRQVQNVDASQQRASTWKMFQNKGTSPLPTPSVNMSSSVSSPKVIKKAPTPFGGSHEDSHGSSAIINDKIVNLHSTAVEAMSSVMDKTLMKISSTVKERMYFKHKHSRNASTAAGAPLHQYALSEEEDKDVDEDEEEIRAPSSVSSWSMASSWSDVSEQRYQKNKKGGKGLQGGLSARGAMLARLSAGSNVGAASAAVAGWGVGIEMSRIDDVEKLFSDLKEDIYLQRQQLQAFQLLPNSPVTALAAVNATVAQLETELEKFDRLWHLDQYGDFRLASSNVASSNAVVALAEAGQREDNDAFVRRLKKDLLRSKQLSRQLFQELQELQRMSFVSHNQYLTVSTVVGVEILHAFVMDLLGRDTLAARIFQWKVQQQLKQQQFLFMRSPLLALTGCSSRSAGSSSMMIASSSASIKDIAMSVTPVKVWQKYIAIFLLIGINGLAALFTILRGYEKGMQWQQSFAVAVFFQILVEVFFTETIDCLFIAFFVPNMIAEEVIRINAMLCDVVHEICSSTSSSTSSATGTVVLTSPSRTALSSSSSNTKGKDPVKALNMPDYFFVSTNVAKSFPSLLESMIVLSYQSYLPGEFGRKWSRGENDEGSDRRRKSSSVVNSWGLTCCASSTSNNKKSWWWKPSILVTRQLSAITALLLTVFVSMPSLLQVLVVRLAQLGLVGSIGRLLLALKMLFSSSSTGASLPKTISPSDWSTSQIVLVTIIVGVILLPLCYLFVRRYGRKTDGNIQQHHQRRGHVGASPGKQQSTPNGAVGIMPPQSPMSPLDAIVEEGVNGPIIDLESPLRLHLGAGAGPTKDNVSSDGVMSTAVDVNLSDRERDATELDLELDVVMDENRDAESGLLSAVLSSWSTSSRAHSHASSVVSRGDSHSPLHKSPHVPLSSPVTLRHSPVIKRKAMTNGLIGDNDIERLYKKETVKQKEQAKPSTTKHDKGKIVATKSNVNVNHASDSEDSWGNQSETSFSNSVLTSCTSIKSMRTTGSVTTGGRKSHQHRHGKKPRGSATSNRPRSLRGGRKVGSHRSLPSLMVGTIAPAASIESGDESNDEVNSISSMDSHRSLKSFKSAAASSASVASFSSLSISDDDSSEFDYDGDDQSGHSRKHSDRKRMDELESSDEDEAEKGNNISSSSDASSSTNSTHSSPRLDSLHSASLGGNGKKMRNKQQNKFQRTTYSDDDVHVFEI